MSSTSVSPPSTPAQPHTPDPSSPLVRITLSTPPSFSAHRARAHSSTPLSPTKDDSPPQSTRGHGRSVSFSADVEQLEGPSTAFEVYRIPQRQPVISESDENKGEASSEPQVRRLPPSALSLSSRGGQAGPLSAISPFSQPIPSTAPSSRFASTAASRGLAITPVSARGARHSVDSVAGVSGPASMWSGVSGGAGSGWISPALGSAGSVGTAARPRGLSVAVLKDDKEMLIGDVPLTAGLSSGAPLRSAGLPRRIRMRSITASDGEDEKDLAHPPPPPNTARTEIDKRKEVILCRYYHTPGLTCTTRPCRFVHNLEARGPSSITDTSTYEMLSPTKTPDPTMGTFAQAQMSGQAKRLKLDELDVTAIARGESVILADETGEEVTGTIFLMSGGGKGPAGKSKAKYKTVLCKDYAEGKCPYGEYCSFIHDGGKPEAKAEVSAFADRDEGEEKRSEQTTVPLRTLKHKKSASTGSFSAWNKATDGHALPPLLKWDEDILEKHKQRLSAFAPPFLQAPLEVDRKGDLVDVSPLVPSVELALEPAPASRPSEAPAAKVSAWSKGAPPSLRTSIKVEPVDARPDEKVLSPRLIETENTVTSYTVPKLAVPPKASAWAKGPPGGLKKVVIAEDDAEHTRSTSHLAPPQSAISLFGTESDPATPWDPAVRRKKHEDAAQAAPEFANPEYSTVVSEAPPPFPLSGDFPVSAYPPAYPWGMPMSPMPAPGYESIMPAIPGGLGVLWTPAGWAVQDVAMKHSLRSLEIKAAHVDARRKPKSYYKSRPCRFFAEGHCPHGENCSYKHVANRRASPSPSACDTEDSGKHTKSTVPVKYHLATRTQPCKFFNSSAGCVSGDSCSFLHTLVVPASVPLVARPRPWRTRPCRHFQLGRCTLGDACHFAHVLDTTHKVKGGKPCRSWGKTGRCDLGDQCGFMHHGDGAEDHAHSLTEEKLAEAFKEMRTVKVKVADTDDEDDDVEIVTEATSTPLGTLIGAL